MSGTERHRVAPHHGLAGKGRKRMSSVGTPVMARPNRINSVKRLSHPRRDPGAAP